MGGAGTAGRKRTEDAVANKKQSGPITTEAANIRDATPGLAAQVAKKPETHSAAVRHQEAGPSTSALGVATAVTSVAAEAPSVRGKRGLSWGDYAKWVAGKGNSQTQTETRSGPSTSGADSSTVPPPSASIAEKRWKKKKKKKKNISAKTPGTGQTVSAAAGPIGGAASASGIPEGLAAARCAVLTGTKTVAPDGSDTSGTTGVTGALVQVPRTPMCPGLLGGPMIGALIGGPEVTRAAGMEWTDKDVTNASGIPNTPEPMESDLEEALLLRSPATQAECADGDPDTL